jgi:hypothetical protein
MNLRKCAKAALIPVRKYTYTHKTNKRSQGKSHGDNADLWLRVMLLNMDPKWSKNRQNASLSIVTELRITENNAAARFIPSGRPMHPNNT